MIRVTLKNDLYVFFKIFLFVFKNYFLIISFVIEHGKLYIHAGNFISHGSPEKENQ